MEVTKHNFASSVPDIEEAIKSADFLAVDGEFTGLYSGADVSSFDTPAECYGFYRRSAKEFLLLQLGVSAFRYDEAARVYRHRTFAFYLFPRPELKGAADKVFGCQSSSLDFLSRHNFDFNKVFHSGISYIDTTEEVKLREFIEEKHKAEKNARHETSNGTRISVPDNVQPILDKMCSDIKDFIKDHKRESIIFDNLNAFQRKLAYEEFEEKFKKEIYTETKKIDESKRALVITRGISEKERMSKMEAAHEKEWAEVEEAIGFSLIARLISDSRKLLIGHNVILDLLHVIDSFFYPLPESYGSFKALTPHIFPNIIDTTYMLKSNTFKEMFSSFDLEGAYRTLKKDPFKMPIIEGEIQTEKYHNAGYDAYITGACFISLFEHLKKHNMPTEDDGRINENSNLLKPFLNKLFLHRTYFQGSPCINLAGKDPNPHREHVFILMFPKEWKRHDINDIFEPYGGLSTVAFIDDTSAYVSLKQHNKAESVKRDLSNKLEKYKIIPYWEYKARTKVIRDDDTVANENDITVSELNDSIEDQSDISSPLKDFQRLKRKHAVEDLGVAEKRTGGDSKASSSSKKTTTTTSITGKSATSPSISSKSSNDKPPKKKKRKLSHTSSGDFVIDDIAAEAAFQESDNWD